MYNHIRVHVAVRVAVHESSAVALFVDRVSNYRGLKIGCVQMNMVETMFVT